jgi:hypothetical protein
MKTTLLLFLAACLCFAQTDVNKLKIIPSATGNAVGEIDFSGKTGPFHVGIAAPDTVSKDVLFRLPASDVLGGGCVNSDGSYNFSMGPCGGANSLTVSPTSPLYLFAHFRDDDQRLYLDYSRDLLNYQPVRKQVSMQAAERDMSVYWDGTKFYFLASGACSVWLWSSSDLETFTTPTAINLTSYLSGCNRSWGPEWNNPNLGPSLTPLGFWVGLGTTSAITPWFFTFNPAINSSPTAGAAVTLSGSTYQYQTGNMNIFDPFPYYDAGSSSYYLIYPDSWTGGQLMAYAKSSTLTGTYTQQTPLATVGPDHFGFGEQSEGPVAVALPDSVARYGVAACVRIYADTWTYTFGAGAPTITGGVNIYPNIGNRHYLWQYVDTCPATVGGDPFAVVEPATATVDTNGTAVTWDSGASFAGIATSSTVNINGTNYTVATVPSPGAMTLTTSAGAQLQVVMPVSKPVPANISSAEQGTVLAITDQTTANIVYRAEDRFHNEPVNQAHFMVGGTGVAPFPLTVQSNLASFWLGNDESPTIAAGGNDTGARYGPESYALWSSCGMSAIACPQPLAGEANWINRYSGFASAIQMDNSATDTGETSIELSNGVTEFGIAPIPGSTLGQKSLWKVGTNNQYFGPITAGGNVANNWFYVYSPGLGPITGAASISNAGFETGNLTGWSSTGSPTVITTAYHYGAYAAALPSGGASVYRTITGLTANTMYMVTAWVQSSLGSTKGTVLTVSYGTGLNSVSYGCNSTNGCIPNYSWYQIGMRYVTDSTGSIIVTLSHASGGSGTAWADDLQVYPMNSTGGSFALGISPSTGEVRANYGLTIGNGDISSISTFPSVSMDSPATGVFNFGDGTFGHANATVQLGGIKLLGSGPGFQIYQNDASGVLTELLRHGSDDNVYLDNYGQASVCTLSGCAPISGGGDIYLRPNASPAGRVVAQGIVDALYTIRSTGNSSPPAGIGTELLYDTGTGNGYLQVINRPSNVLLPLVIDAAQVNINPGSAGSLLLNGYTDIQSGMPSGNGSLFGFNSQNVAGAFTANITGSRSGYLYFDNVGMSLFVTPGTQTAGTALAGAVKAMYVSVNGDTAFTTMRSTSQVVPTSGAGTEVVYDISTATGYIHAYDRTANTYLPLNIDGSTLALYAHSGSATLSATTFAVSGTIQSPFHSAGGALLNPDIDYGNKVEALGVTGVALGAAYVVARSASGGAGGAFLGAGAGILSYLGSTTSEGFLGTVQNDPFSLRQNNADVLTLPTTGGVNVTALNILSGGFFELGGTSVTSGTNWTGGVSGGASGTATMRNSANTGSCTIIFNSSGQRTGGSC